MHFVNLANIFLQFKLKSSRYILILRAEQSSWYIKTGSAVCCVEGPELSAYELLQNIPQDETGVCLSKAAAAGCLKRKTEVFCQ